MRNAGWSNTAKQLYEHLESTQKVCYLTSNKRHVHIRCPFCGDSIKNAKSAHLYVELQSPFQYFCQRCQTGGIMTSEVLKSLNIRDSEFFVEIHKEQKKHRKKFKSLPRKASLIIPVAEDNKLNRFKLNYINERLGTNLTFEDLPKFKICLNLYDVLDANNVKSLTCKTEDMGDKIDKNFIGFVSYDSNYIIMRNLSKKVMMDMRYHNYNVFGEYETSKKFYIIPTKIDILQPKLRVKITEGCFDILSIYHNIDTNHDNTLYIAVNGKNYNMIFEFLARLGFLEMDIEIFSDEDVSLNYFKQMKKDLKDILVGGITVSYNKMPKEKDFGVRKERILKKSTTLR